MLEIEGTDGRKAWVSVLHIKSIEAAARPDECMILFTDDAKAIIKGSAASIAATITRLLRTIHGGS